MAYTKHTWQTGEVVTASKLNNMETGIYDADAAAAAKYTKPSSGIPKTDLASAVQTSLGKADSALQEHQDISGKQDVIDSSHKLAISLVSGYTTKAMVVEYDDDTPTETFSVVVIS